MDGLLFKEYLAGGLIGFGLSMLIGSILPYTHETAYSLPSLADYLIAATSAAVAAYLVSRKLQRGHLQSGLLVGISAFLVNLFVSFPLGLILPGSVWQYSPAAYGINLLNFSLGGLLGGLIAIIAAPKI